MNLLITSAPARWAMLQFVLVTLALMPALIYGHGHHGSGGKKHAIALAELASGAHLVMETRNGDVLVRPAREAAPAGAAGGAEVPATLPAGTPATVGTVGGNGKRVKNNNKKSNKSQNQMQQQLQQQQQGGGGAGRKSGHKKSSSTVAGEEPLQHQQGQQGHHNKQRQTPRQHQQQQQLTQHRAGKRSGGGGKKASEKGPTCRYTKSSWTECDAKTNMRTRTLSLKKGESNCQATRTVQKKCKKACRYEKGNWSECTAGVMTREDKLKPSEDGSPQTCNPVRSLDRKCNPGGGQRANKERKHKEKGTRRTVAQI